MELGERFGDEMEDGSTLIPLRLTRAELAALVGTTVETTIRTLSRWSREGLVTTNDAA
jgi:CRP-like cAMP-binding protein